MAVPTVVAFSSQEIGTDEPNVVLSNPAGVQDGDFFIAKVNTGLTGNSVTPPAGWRPFVDENGGLAFTNQLFYRFWNTGDPTTHQFDFSTNQQTSSQIVAIRGVDTRTPIDSFLMATGTTATPTCPNLTGGGTQVDECLVMRIYGADDDDVATDTGYPGGTTGLYVRTSSAAGSTCTSGAAHEEQLVAGFPGTAAFTLDASEGWRAWTIALAPPQPAPPSNPEVFTKAYEFTTGGTPGNQSFTGVGFEGKGMRIEGSHTTDETITTHAQHMVGMTDGTNDRVIVVAEQDGAQNTRRDIDEAACILIIDETTDADLIRATFVSWDSDGFTLNVTPTVAGVKFRAYIIGGDDVDATVGQDTANDAPVTSVGHRPDLVFTMSAGLGPAGAPSQHSIHGFGCFDTNFNQWCVLSFQGADAADQTNKDSVLFTDAFIGQLFQGARTWSSSVTLMTNQGFSWIGENADEIYYLSFELKGRKCFVGTFTAAGATGNQDLPDFLMVPQSYMLATAAKIDEVATTPSGTSVSVGTYDGSDSAINEMSSENSATVARQHTDDADVISWLVPAGTVGASATPLAITDSTPTINWDVVTDTAAVIIGICAIEEVDAGVAAPGDTPFFGANF